MDSYDQFNLLRGEWQLKISMYFVELQYANKPLGGDVYTVRTVRTRLVKS